ncbi:MAG TPA: hypothetical protein VKZ83_11570, partial [Phototrophicaceae bacterium]|nr:hypothetical protein [Phototrophicaceae bacterium]
MQLTESDARALVRLSLPTDAALRRMIDEPTVGRGLDYARRGMVQRLHVDPDQRALFATVRGSGPVPYQTFVLVHGPDDVQLHCTCPVRLDCKHAVATVVAAREAASGGGLPDWERALTGAVEGGTSAGEPLGLQFERVVGRGPAAGGDRTAARVRIVPVVRGARGTWVRTGVTWSNVRWSWGRFDPEHVEALRALVASHPTYASHVHLDELGSAVWPLLRQVVDAGIALVPHRGLTGEVTVSATPAEVTLDVTTHPFHDGVRVAPAVSVGGRTVGAHAVAFVGHPVHGVAVTDDGLLLAPLARALPAGASELVTGEPLHIPPDGVEKFRREFFPRLLRLLPVRSSDGAVDLPEVAAPVLVLAVAHEPDVTVRLTWSFRYRTADGVTDVPVGAPAEDDAAAAPAGWVRDLPREARLLEEVVL